MKCSDLPDLDVLTAIAATDRPLGATIWEVQEALPHFPAKLVRAKLSKLLRRGLITGCTCGCRGDFFVVAVEEILHCIEPKEALTQRFVAKAVAKLQDTIEAHIFSGGNAGGGKQHQQEQRHGRARQTVPGAADQASGDQEVTAHED